jgi:predicted DNA-binding protein with PD1-like motif
MRCLPVRLPPGADLRESLQEAVAGQPAFVLGGIGSLRDARLRLAGCETETLVPGDVEILTLSGTLTPDGVHLHMAVADARGVVTGGHVGRGNIVRTTAEVLLALLPDWQLRREHDPRTGYAELVVRDASAARK